MHVRASRPLTIWPLRCKKGATTNFYLLSVFCRSPYLWTPCGSVRGLWAKIVHFSGSRCYRVHIDHCPLCVLASGILDPYRPNTTANAVDIQFPRRRDGGTG